MIKLFLTTVFIASCTLHVRASGKENSDKKIIESNFPKSISELRDEDTGKTLSLAEGNLRYLYKEAALGDNLQEKYLIVLYQAFINTVDIACELRAINKRTGKISAAPISSIKDELYGCDEIKIQDLDGDNKPEVMITTVDKVGANPYIYFFKWDGEKLIDLTPATNGTPDFRAVTITDVKIDNKALIIDSPAIYRLHGEESDISENKSEKTYFLQDGKFVEIGSYDFFEIVTKKLKSKVATTTFSPRFLTDGSYTLDVKNLSKHKKPIRAEINVNGNTVLKPQDFCQSPPPKDNKKNKHGKHHKHNDDDMNEDHHKGCKPKKDVFAIVNVKGPTEIKVQLYGPGDSALQISMKKR